MSDLRLFLMLGGILLIAGIYLWAVFQNRQQKRQQTLRDFPAAEHPVDINLKSTTDASIDYRSTLADLSRSMTGAREEKIEANLKMMDGAGNNSSKISGPDASAIAVARVKEEKEETRVQTESTRTEEVSQIIIFNIIPRAKEHFTGTAIMEALTEVDMQLGEMEIFHHYGLGDMKMEKPLFSLANILEPGNFAGQEMSEFKTPGLVMFMCVPTPIDSEVVFELMLNTAQRLAESLGADVCDEKRELLSEQSIDAIRQDIVEKRHQ